MKKDTIAAIATAMSNSGIGIVRISGAESLDIVKKIYKGKQLEDHAIHYGYIIDGEETIDEDGSLAINLEGENMGVLIGKRGQTLDSLQYLTNRVANKMQDGYVRVKLDTENYRQRRKETLENLAKNIAHKVKRTKKSVSLEPMNPYERRIIHSALQGDKYISTHSEGEEPYRRVVVTMNRK